LLQASLNYNIEENNYDITMSKTDVIKTDKKFNLYRSCSLPIKIIKEYENKINTNSGGFLIYNEFLPTTYDINVALRFVKNLSDDKLPCLFEYSVPIKGQIGCAFIEDYSAFKSEKEVLFTSACIF